MSVEKKAAEIQTSELIKFEGIELVKGTFRKMGDGSGGFILRDLNGNLIYHKDKRENWEKWEYDSEGREIRHKTSGGYLLERKYDFRGHEIFRRSSLGSWRKAEFSSNGERVYFESSSGCIECTREWLDKNYVKKGEEQNA